MLRLVVSSVAALATAIVCGCSAADSGPVGTATFTSVALTVDPTAVTVARGDSVLITATATIEPQGLVISNAADNMAFTFSNTDVAEINGSGYVQGDSVGHTTLTITFTDTNHGFAATSVDVPITVGASAP